MGEVWVLRSTRQWIARDLDLLKPIFERMRAQGFNLLEKNAALSEELRRTFPEIDRIEKELGKAAKAVQLWVSAFVVRYRDRLRDLCETAISTKKEPSPDRDKGDHRALGA